MKHTIKSLIIAILLAASSSQTLAQTNTTKPETVKPETVKPETVKPETVKPETVKPETVKPPKKPEGDESQSEVAFNWSKEVWGPIVKLAGVVLIVGILLRLLALTQVLRSSLWSERTIFALAIIFTFCISALVNVSKDVFLALKDVALVVVGFYFGASRASDAQPKPTDTEATRKANAEARAKADAEAEAAKKKAAG